MLKKLLALLALATATTACDVVPFYANPSRDVVVYAPLAYNNISNAPASTAASADPRPFNPSAINYAYIADTTGGSTTGDYGSTESDYERVGSNTGVYEAPMEDTNYTSARGVGRSRYGNLRQK
jgi:hypothetical protein